MSIVRVRFNKLGFQTEFDVIHVDNDFLLFWHKKRVGRFNSFKQALDFARHLGID